MSDWDFYGREDQMIWVCLFLVSIKYYIKSTIHRYETSHF